MNFLSRIFLYRLFTVLFIAYLLLGFRPGNNKMNIITKGNQKYLANTVIVKLKEAPVTSADGKAEMPSGLNSYLKNFDFTSSTSLFPNRKNDYNFGFNRIVMIKYDSDSDPKLVSSKLKNLPGVEWAEPKFVYELDYTVNDPSYATQWNLLKIKADSAWNISTGDTNIVIGIVDTGIDWDHPDLAANIWRNWKEDGSDADNNGYLNDIRGWDFGGLHGDPDNNPMEDRPDHGTHVAGITSAVTNNEIGIASIGFNSKIMAVKTTIDDERGPNGPYIIYGYEGIKYAVDNGAKVINCSWGGGGYSIFGQETIDYAISKGALVVAAAGNDNSSEPHYPSSYKGVLSVGSTTSEDKKSGFSNYGTDIDVSAPGSGIFSTWMNDTYATISGTSMASPLAAGLAALVFAHFPDYTPLQVAEQIRVNSDNIDNLNPGYINLLGYGRINALASLDNSSSISVRGISFVFNDGAPGGNGNGLWEAGETISLTVNFVNYLSPTSNLHVILESKNNYSSIISGDFVAGSHNTLEEFNNNDNKFYISLNGILPQNVDLKFLLKFSDGSYSDYQWIKTVGNPTYATQFGNNVAMTITSKGTFGYNDYPDNLQGEGFHYLDGDNMLFEGALILGTSATQISDAARGSDQNFQDEDFSVIQPFILNSPGSIADVEGSSVFNDDNVVSGEIGIKALLTSYTFTSPPHDNYIILNYKFINTSGNEINNFRAGLFFDWDIIDGSGLGDKTTYDTDGNLSYTYNTTGGPNTWVTTALISSDDYLFYAIDNGGNDGDFQVYDGFTDAEKWKTLSSGISKTTAGPDDISHVIGGGPFNIGSGDTINVGFVVGTGLNLEDLRSTVTNARTKYQEILVTDIKDKGVIYPTEFSLDQNYPNPFNPSTKIKYSVPSVGTQRAVSVLLKVYDILGNEVAALVNEEQSAGEYEVEFDAQSFSSGIYFYKLTAGTSVLTKKMILLR